MERLFRLLLIVQLLTASIIFFISWDFAYGENVEMALTWQGHNSLIDDRFIYFSNLLISILYITSYIGLLFFKKWARVLLLLVSIIGGFLISLYGISIQSSFESMLGYFMTLIDGTLIAISFATAINTKFNGDSSGH